ncbi:MAG: DNA-binding protein [Flavobacterium sp.]|nr:DNA-binding protein [Flavobacterium sp.]
MAKKFFERLKRIDSLIQKKATGNPVDLARRLEISESTLYEFLALMRSFGAPIKYDKEKNTYYYTEIGNFNIFFEKK